MPFQTCQRSFRLTVLVLLWLTAGCSGGGADRPETVPVTGAVMYNGSPVQGAQVSFLSEGAPRAATGVTNEKGEFQLSTFDINDGAVIGEHVITVTKITGEATTDVADPRAMTGDPSAMTNMYQERMGAQGEISGPKTELPQKYSNPKTTTLKETVTAAGPNSFVLQLVD